MLIPGEAGCPWRFLSKEFAPWQAVRTWHDRSRADGIWTDIAALHTRAVRAKCGRAPEPTTAILDSQSVVSGPQKGLRGVHGNRKVWVIKREVLTCLLGSVPATLVTVANVHDTQPIGALLDRAAQASWAIERVKVDGIYVGPRVAQAARDHDAVVQVEICDADVRGFKPLAHHGDIWHAYQPLSPSHPHLEQSPATAMDAISIANCHHVLRAYHRPEYVVA